MRCYICDRVIDDPQFNSDHKDYDPCEVCLEIITELVQGYDEENYQVIDDDDLLEDWFRTVQYEEYQE